MKTVRVITKFLITFVQHSLVSDILQSEAKTMTGLGGDNARSYGKLSKNLTFMCIFWNSCWI